MLEDGDILNVNPGPIDWHVDVSPKFDDVWEIRAQSFVNIPVKTPFAINLSQIEYCKGAINPETNNYELKVRFCSGHELWLAGEAAVELLHRIGWTEVRNWDEERKELSEKFKEKIK